MQKLMIPWKHESKLGDSGGWVGSSWSTSVLALNT
jgi:hypothetical protein